MMSEVISDIRGETTQDTWGEHNPKKHFVSMSMGAGVQTTAMLLKWPDKFDHVIFADTGDEKQETYEYIEQYLKPFCKEHDIPWHTVREPKYESLMQHCTSKKIIPIAARRWCTHDHKIVPIRRQLRKLGACSKKQAFVAIGISIDESNRLNASSFVDKPRYEHKIYPLIDNRISRQDCYQIIKDHGWPLPVKSGCDFCPFAGRKQLWELARTDPKRFAKIVEMERIHLDSDLKTRNPLIGEYPLTVNQSLDTFTDSEDSCDSGHCFV